MSHYALSSISLGLLVVNADLYNIIMTRSDETIEMHERLSSPESYNPAQGLVTLARIIARVHIARLANKTPTVADNSHSNGTGQINDKINHEDIS